MALATTQSPYERHVRHSTRRRSQARVSTPLVIFPSRRSSQASHSSRFEAVLMVTANGLRGADYTLEKLEDELETLGCLRGLTSEYEVPKQSVR